LTSVPYALYSRPEKQNRDKGCPFLEEELDLFTLLDEKHRITRQAIEHKWNQTHTNPIKKSEWFILNRINGEKKLLSEVCRNDELSRQGSHKVIRNLEKRGLLKTEIVDHQKRTKYVELTSKGIYYVEEIDKLKQEVEEQVKEMIGEDLFYPLKKALAENWEVNKTRMGEKQ
jgi:DNA-binding MarR family transcriptional regulator